jgi:hypothetical protein
LLISVIDEPSVQMIQIFLDVLWYCRQLFAKRTAKGWQCDDEPSVENGFYDTPSDAILQLLTVLQLLGMKAVGANIVIVRGASLFARAALDIIESPSTTTPVNKWTTSSTRLSTLLPEACFYWTPHVVYYMRIFTRLFQFFEESHFEVRSNLSKKTPKDSFLKPDALWVKTLPRVVFVELYILLNFYSPGKVLDDMQLCFDRIRKGDAGGGLLEMLKGAGSAVDMGNSALSLHECQESYCSGQGWDRVVDPPLRRDVTERTRTLLQTDIARDIQNTTPNPRFVKRLNDRDTRLRLELRSVVVDRNGREYETGILRERIEDAKEVELLYECFVPVVRQIRDRLSSKITATLSSKKQQDGSCMVVGSRGQGLSMIKDGKRWISAQIISADADGLQPAKDKKPSVKNVFNAHILFPASANSGDLLEDCVIACKSSEKPGSFAPNTWEKASVQHELLSVCLFLTSRVTASFLFPREANLECSGWIRKAKDSSTPVLEKQAHRNHKTSWSLAQ